MLIDVEMLVAVVRLWWMLVDVDGGCFVYGGRAQIEVAAQERYKALQKSEAAEARVTDGVVGWPFSRLACPRSIVHRAAKSCTELQFRNVPCPYPTLSFADSAKLSFRKSTFLHNFNEGELSSLVNPLRPFLIWIHTSDRVVQSSQSIAPAHRRSPSPHLPY